MNNSKPKVVVVTGASAGVGRATAQRFAAEGCAVALIARGRAGLEGAAKEVESAGGQPLVITADVTDADALDAAALKVEQQLGPIDVWVNAAFSSVFSKFEDIKPDEFDRTTQVTYLGFVNGTRSALRHMQPRNTGTIVQIGSALAYRGIPLQSAYCGAKHAIKGFTESVRCELMHERSKVRITMVQLPAHNTPQFDWVVSRLPKKPQPVPPIYDPEVAAEAAFHAATHYRREWYVTSSSARAIMANKVIPGLLDRYLARSGFSSQERSEMDDPNRPANLFEPLDDNDDWGMHGSFDRTSRKSADWQWPLTKHRRVAWSLAGLGSVATAFVVRRVR